VIRIGRLGDDGAYILRDGGRDAARVRLVHRLRLLRVVGALVLLQGCLRQLKFRFHKWEGHASSHLQHLLPSLHHLRQRHTGDTALCERRHSGRMPYNACQCKFVALSACGLTT
jgi:hypothetical protein